MCRLSSNLGASDSWNPHDLSRPVMGLLIQYTDSYMFRQWSGIIREFLGFVWVTWNEDRIGGISYNCGYVACVSECCGSVCCASQLSWKAHRPQKHTLYDIPPIRSAFQVTQTNQRSSLMMADHCRNMYVPVYWIRKSYNSVHVLVVYATSNNARYEH
jgi:hypothetical protein